MTKIGPWIIIKVSEFPAFEKANRLARTLTDTQIEVILSGKASLHLNPRKKKDAQADGASKLAEYARRLAPAAENSFGLGGSLYPHPTEPYHKPGK